MMYVMNLAGNKVASVIFPAHVFGLIKEDHVESICISAKRFCSATYSARLDGVCSKSKLGGKFVLNQVLPSAQVQLLMVDSEFARAAGHVSIIQLNVKLVNA